jgi:hypothetical protein
MRDDGDESEWEVDDEEDDNEKKGERGEATMQRRSGKRTGTLKTDPAASAGPQHLHLHQMFSTTMEPPRIRTEKYLHWTFWYGRIRLGDPRRNRGEVLEPSREASHVVRPVEREGLRKSRVFPDGRVL